MNSPTAAPCPDRVEGHVSHDDDWIVTLHSPAARLTLRRATSIIQVDDDRPSRRSQTLALQAPDDVLPQLADLRQAYADVATQYPRFRDLTRYRVRVSFVLLLMVTTQEALFAMPTVLKRRSHLFRALTTLAWALFGTWLMVFYFR